jgi:DNA-binding response OmpR family regulator
MNSPARILVCDDDAAVLSIIRFKLTREGLGEVTTAAHGREALELLAAQRFDLIVADLHMPFHSGMELITHVRGTLQAATPILILSAEGVEDTILQAFDLGADDYVSKPFSLSELVLRVKRLLKQ